MNVQIPVKWLQELLALCGPEDHELRERVMVSITAMDEQAARAVARPEHDEAVNEVMELVGSAMDSSMKAGELLLDSHEKFNAQFASAKSLKNLVESKLRAVLVNVHAPQAQADARDAEQERWMGIGKAIERACVDLPVGAEIILSLEKDAGTVTLTDEEGDEQENFPTDGGLAGVVNAAIEAAIAAAKGE